jgi:uncharacterized protein HemX
MPQELFLKMNLKNKIMQINLSNINYKAILPYLVIIALGISLYFKCNDVSKLEFENKNLQTEVKYKQQLGQFYLDKVNELEPRIRENENQIDSLNAVISIKEQSISELKNQYDEKIKQLNRYTVSAMQRYFDERYGTGKKSNP